MFFDVLFTVKYIYTSLKCNLNLLSSVPPTIQNLPNKKWLTLATQVFSTWIE